MRSSNFFFAAQRKGKNWFELIDAVANFNRSFANKLPSQWGHGLVADNKMTDFTSSLKSRVTALAENARDLTLDFEAASGSRFFDNDDQTLKEVQTLLSSRLDREKLEALRRLVAVISTDISI